jgi:signal recognition particle receptor subunit beta
MVLFNYSTKELTAKVVYYGPGLCGKTTNLQWIHEKLPIKNKGKMLSLATETDRTLFFDFLPIELGTIRGMKTRIQLYTVPGQVFYNATRRMVLKGADCVVFVADSQDAMLEANAESLENLKENLEVNDISLDDVPLVLQYNKRDLPNALPVDQLNARLNPRGVPYYEAVAVKGVGVEETLKGVTSLVFKSLATRYGGIEGKAAASKTSVPAPNIVKPSAATAPQRPAPVPNPPPSAPPPAPPPPPARATGAFSPSDLLEADPIEVGPEEMELDLQPTEDSGDGLEELSLDDLGAEPAPPPAAAEEPFDLDLELEESPPLETVEEFSPLSELEGFDAPGVGGSTTSPFGATTQPRPADDDPLAGLGGDEPPPPPLGTATTPLGGGFDPSSLGSDEDSLDPGSLLESEPEAPPLPEPEPSFGSPGGWDPSALSAPEPEPAGFDPASFAEPEAPPLPEPEPQAEEAPELDLPGFGEPPPAPAEEAQELELDDLFDSPGSDETPPLPEPEPMGEDPVLELSMDDGAGDDPLADLGFDADDSDSSPMTAPVPRYVDEPEPPRPPEARPFPEPDHDDPLSGLGGDAAEPLIEAPPLPDQRPEPRYEPPAPAPPMPEDDPFAPEPEPPASEEDPFASEPFSPPPAPEPPPEPAPRARRPAFEAPPPRQEPPPPAPAPTPPAARPTATARASAPGVATATVERAITPTVGSIALAGGGTENDITIPVEVTLGPGGATQVNLNIRLTLNFKLQ